MRIVIGVFPFASITDSIAARGLVASAEGRERPTGVSRLSP
jgi:hypothetical protein